VLLQLLILGQHLPRVKTQPADTNVQKEFQPLTARVWKLLEATPPHGAAFSRAVRVVRGSRKHARQLICRPCADLGLVCGALLTGAGEAPAGTRGELDSVEGGHGWIGVPPTFWLHGVCLALTRVVVTWCQDESKCKPFEREPITVGARKPIPGIGDEKTKQVRFVCCCAVCLEGRAALCLPHALCLPEAGAGKENVAVQVGGAGFHEDCRRCHRCVSGVAWVLGAVPLPRVWCMVVTSLAPLSPAHWAGSRPSLEVYLTPYRDAVDPVNEIEDEYNPKHNKVCVCVC